MRTDEELIAATRRGDDDAFAALYDRHKAYAFRVARRFSPDEHLALDAVQNTFAYLVRKLTEPDFRLTARLTTLLYPVAKHEAQAIARKHRRELATDPHTLPDPADEATPSTEASDLAGVLDRLGEPFRETVLLRFVDGMTVPEVAAALGVPAGTVKSRLNQAVRKLREDPVARAYFEP